MQTMIYIAGLSIFIILPRGIDSNCILSNRGYDEHNFCIGDIICLNNTINFIDTLDRWSCRRSREGIYDYDNYGQQGLQMSENYYINVTIRDIFYADEETFGIEFESNSRATHVIKLEANNVNMLIIPSQINSYIHLKDINLSNNNIEIINLSQFLDLNELKKINVSYNAISTMAVDFEDSSIRTSGVISIDLSNNLIEKIPNNYFLHYSQLQYLDLSYNLIKSFNMVTFEGIMKLQTLYLSHNKLNSFGYTLTRFVNLIELNLDQNHLTSIHETNFVAMSKLQKLNLSSNFIEYIENKAFNSLADLLELDLGYNKIDVITKELLTDNSQLQTLSLSYNNIKQIETGAFENKTIKTFQIDNNNLMNSIDKNTFQGIYVNCLNLIRCQIKSLGPEAFSAMNTTLTSLNLSSNLINNISKSSFCSLNLLTELDLSYNNLSDVDLDTNDLKNLKLLFVQNNSIQKIRKDTFSNFISLTYLDLSFNSINEIDPQALDELKKLEVLILKHNPLLNTIEANTFQGLISLKSIDIMNTNITSYENDVFYDTKFLKQLNSSHGQLSFIGFNILKRCDTLEVLDFSYNLLENFDINTTTIAGVKEIYLNNNKIRKITNETFTSLALLRVLSLSYNNIIDLESRAFYGLRNLVHLYLFSNPDMEISDTSFNNLTLTDLSLGYVKKIFNFQYTIDASVTNLKIQQCDIVNISTVYVFKIANVQKLNLRSNKIAILDKSSFQNMPHLIWLDLSFNKITYIQPGTFMNTNMINVLDLNWNYIQSLQYGVLDGLKNLRQLNLSNNILHSFGANLLHNSPYIENIYLDDNAIQFINFHDFVTTGIKSISIGGNPISCDIFVEVKKENFNDFNITTKQVNFNSENVDGITCRTVSNNTRELDHIFSQNSTDSIGKVLAELSNSIEKLRESIDISNNKTLPNELLAINGLANIMSNFKDMIVKLDKNITIETNGLRSNFTKILNKFITSSNESQIVNNKFMNQLIDVNNETRFYMESLNELIKNKTIGSEERVDGGKTQITLFEEILQRIIVKERDALKNEMHGSIQSLQSSSFNDKQFDRDILRDVKMILYFIAICLALNLVCVVCYILYKHSNIKRRLISNKIHNSSQPIANVMELE